MSKLTIAMLLVLTSTASASELVAANGPTPHAAPRRVEGAIGMLLGGADVGDANGFSLGVSGGLGYRIGDLTLRAVFDYYKVGDGAHEALHRHGRATHIGGALRYSFANTGPERKVGVDFWGELGAGYERVAWLAGGVLDRPDAELAVGLDVGFRGHRDRRGRRREIGYFLALRTLLGEAPAMSTTPTCGGPCTRATTPPRTDVTMFFDFGLHWGR